MSTESLGNLEEVVQQLREENDSLRKQIAEPDLRAFEQIRDLRITNKKLTDEMKRLTTECVQLAFKGRQLENELKESRNQGTQMGQSIEALQGELTHSKETVLTHEAELARQKEELNQRQQEMVLLQDELNQRENRIGKLESLVNELKDQFLSGEVAALEVTTGEGQPYRIMVSHMEKLMGFAGQTVVDQVFQLTGADPSCTDSAKVEEIYEALQDTAAAFVRGTPEEKNLQPSLERCWAEIQGTELKPGAAEAVAAAEAVVAAATPAAAEPEAPAPEPEPEPVVEEAVAEPVAEEAVAEPVSEEVVAEEPVAEESAAVEETVAESVEEAPAEEVPAVEEEPAAEEAAAEEAVVEEVAPEEVVAEEPAVEEPAVEEIYEEAVVEETPAEEPVVEEPAVEEEPVVEEVLTMEEAVPGLAEEAAPISLSEEKIQRIQEGAALVSTDPSLAQQVLEEALAMEVWVEEESLAHLSLARVKAGNQPILEHLISCMPWVEVPDLFELMPYADLNASQASQNVCQLLLSLGSQSRGESAQLEGKLGLGGRSANRDMISKIGYEEEEQLVEVLLERVLPKSGLKLSLPGEQWERRREQSSPAAFVGTLRQALRGVDYTLFDFHQLEVLSYSGEEQFLVDGTIEPNLGLMFHYGVEGTVPEEIRFLAFRRLVQMYRRYTNLAQFAESFDDAARIALVRGTIGIYEDEHGELNEELKARVDQLEQGSSNFPAEVTTLLRDLYEVTELEAFLDLSDWLFGQQLVERRLSPMADHFASKVVGFTTATYATLRDELLAHGDLFTELESAGVARVFQSEGDFTGLRMRLQRFWAEALQATLA